MAKTLGIVLSGGGVRGVAHIGVLQALAEHNIRPQVVAGASAGAIVGALYARGCSTTEMLDFWEKTNPFQLSYFALGKPGFIDTDKMVSIFESYFPENSFEALPVRLFITATDIANARLKVFDSGPLIQPVLASAAFPGVFSPVLINGMLYSDGGIANNFPVEPVRGLCDAVLGVYVNPIQPLDPAELDSAYQVTQRAFALSLHFDSIMKFSACDRVIAPERLSSFGTFELGRMEEIFEIGYFETLRHIEDIRSLLNDQPGHSAQ